MFFKIQEYFKSLWMKKHYSKIKIDKYEIWVNKNYQNEIQEIVDSIITMAKMLEYTVKFEVVRTKDASGNFINDGRYKVEILFYENDTVVIPFCGIRFATIGNIIEYFLTFEKDKSTTEKKKNNTGYYAYHKYDLKYNSFIKNLKQMPRLF